MAQGRVNICEEGRVAERGWYRSVGTYGRFGTARNIYDVSTSSSEGMFGELTAMTMAATVVATI